MRPPPRLSNPLQRHLQQRRQHLRSLPSLPLPWLLLCPTQKAKALNQSSFAALLLLRISRSQRTPSQRILTAEPSLTITSPFIPSGAALKKLTLVRAAHSRSCLASG